MLLTESRSVPFLNLPAQFVEERHGLMPIVEAVFAKSVFVGGEDVGLLEDELASALAVPHVIALNSGTDALLIGLAALGIGRGDEVITPSNSFVASTAAIAHVGATPVFADLLENQMIDPTAVEAAITARTRAIMPVHLTGRVADMTRLRGIADRHGLAIIEDAAQSFGSRFDGQSSGTFGDVGAFSAHPLKNLNAAGDAGFLVCRDGAIGDKVRRLRNHGLADRDRAEIFGFVSRMDTLQAAVLRYRLPRAANVIERRRSNAALYDALLDGTVFVPPPDSRVFNSYHLYVVQVDRRDALQSALQKRGIGTKVHYPIPIHLQPAAAHLGYKKGSLPVTESQAARILSIPIHQFLSSDDVEYVAKSIREFYA